MVEDLAERETELGSAITTWVDENGTVFIQYNSVTLSMPFSDFISFSSTLNEATSKIGGDL